ncbi:MAG: ATPase P [Desulfobulbaceae bacterium BRH_c16a]|nr:MAG: ATPase P [Desulfobulbaceae bacterium BRH_c16a]
MIEIFIPGNEPLRIEHLVLDYNGTLAEDGELIEGVLEKMVDLAQHMLIHVITADTHGTVEEKLEGLPCSLKVIDPQDQDRRKWEYVVAIGPKMVAAVGNGRNDALMLQTAVLGICVIQKEGASSKALHAADIICNNILDVLDLFLQPARLRATLRN